MSLDLQSHTHRRLNQLTGEWVLVSPHRTARPWQGQVESLPPDSVPPYDSNCYMCPGNARANGERNPPYTSTFVFQNDFAALTPDTPDAGASSDPLLSARGEPGLCHVVCFSPRHDVTLARMTAADVRAVVDVWAAQCREISREAGIQYVQVFENRGAAMGASNPHPHGQIWATTSLPNEVVKEQNRQHAYFQQHGRDLLGDYLAREQQAAERLVCANDHFVAIVPFWAIWPFETILLPRRHVGALEDLQDAERDALADILKRLTTRYDNLFSTPFPYSMGFHVRPCDGQPHPEWRLHAHFYPPLLRSATIRKFMVGYELLGTPQRDLTPERAAEQLRGVSDERLS